MNHSGGIMDWRIMRMRGLQWHKGRLKQSMSDFIKNIEIENFKSIRHQTIDGCKRINVFIGYPNVGKSNILEALSLFSLPYLRINGSRKLTKFIRLKNLQELF